MSQNQLGKNKPKAIKNVKIRTTKNIKVNDPNGGAMPNDIIEKEDFDNLSDEDKENDEDVIVEGEEQKEEDDDILENEDYGDEEQKDVEEEQDVEYEQGEAEADTDGNCLYKFAKKITSDSEDDDDEFVFEDDTETKKNDLIVNNEDRETKPILTKYERVRILGDRAKQLSLGAKPMLLNVDNMNPKDIAKLELERGVIPFIIEKILPDGRRERWKVSELKIVN